MTKGDVIVKAGRDPYIDFLRFLGLALIILVHVNCPNLIKQIRCFDVPLMVFVSGLSCSYKSGDFWGYLLKRTKRLIIPTWIFFYYIYCVDIAKE